MLIPAFGIASGARACGGVARQGEGSGIKRWQHKTERDTYIHTYIDGMDGSGELKRQ